MAADDRELRDELEQLQVRAKQLRGWLDDADRLDEVRTEVGEDLDDLKAERAEKEARLAQVSAAAEEARMRSMQAKREAAEQNVVGNFAAATRVTFAIGTTLMAGMAAAHFATPWDEALHLPGTLVAGVGATCLVAWVYRIAVDLRR